MTDDIEVKSQEQLQAEIKTAVDAGNWADVKRISGEIAKLVKTEEKAEHEAKLAIVGELTGSVKEKLDKVVAKMRESGELDNCDGVWYADDFGEVLSTCRLLKSQPKARTGGGGAGKKFSITTNELLAQFGDQPNGDTGQSFKDAYEGTTDGNKRYQIRMKLLKLANIS